MVTVDIIRYCIIRKTQQMTYPLHTPGQINIYLYRIRFI